MGLLHPQAANHDANAIHSMYSVIMHQPLTRTLTWQKLVTSHCIHPHLRKARREKDLNIHAHKASYHHMTRHRYDMTICQMTRHHIV
jgi:hypothetical protein